MKKRLIWVMVLSFLMFGAISGKTVHASEGPAFLIEEDYVIINYERYELVDNKIFFDGLEYELMDNNFISQIHNDTKAIPSTIL